MENTFGNGQMQPSDAASDFNVMSFVIQQALSRTRTMVLVKVVAVTNNGGVAPVGSVDVHPLVNMLDGAGVASPHGIILGLPYTRIQGGANAVIIDPAVGDIGWAAIADRDISSVKETKAQANPGSFRRFDMADGVYIGGILNGIPEQYVQMNSDGVKVVDKNGNSIAMTAAGIVITGTLIVNNIEIAGTIKGASGAEYAGDIATTGTVTGSDVIAGAIHLTTHKHSGVTAGVANSGGPVP